MKEENEFIKERDLIVDEIGGFSEEDFAKSGISLEEYSNPNAETISKLINYAKEEYDQITIYSE